MSNLLNKQLVFVSGAILAFQMLQAAPETETNETSFKIHLKSAWVQKTNATVGISIPSLQSKEAVYIAQYMPKNSMEVAVVAIKNPKSGKVWIGQQQDFYIETDSQIIGGFLTLDGSVRWCDGLISNSNGEDLDVAIGRFDKEIDGPTLASRRTRSESGLNPVLGRHFFTRRNDDRDSETIQAKVKAVETQGGRVQIDLENPITHSVASVWFNSKTLKPVKATENGRQIFPMSLVLVFLSGADPWFVISLLIIILWIRCRRKDAA